MKVEKINSINLSKESYLHRIISDIKTRRDDLEFNELY